MTIGERFRMAREHSKLSQGALAELCGVSRGQIAKLEVGERTNPRGSDVSAIANATGVRLRWLLEEDGPMLETEGDTAIDRKDPYPQRAAAIARMRGLVSDAAIATVRADQMLGTLTEAEWVEELIRADKLARKGLERHDGQPHQGDGPVGRSSSKILPRRR